MMFEHFIFYLLYLVLSKNNCGRSCNCFILKLIVRFNTGRQLICNKVSNMLQFLWLTVIY